MKGWDFYLPAFQVLFTDYWSHWWRESATAAANWTATATATATTTGWYVNLNLEAHSGSCCDKVVVGSRHSHKAVRFAMGAAVIISKANGV